MIEKLGIYKCQPCEIIVEALTDSEGEIMCCDKPMENLIAKTADQGREKHVPVMEKIEEGVKVKIGSVPHPMEEKHYIQWIEIIANEKAYRQFLEPGQAPEAVFNIDADDIITVREYCNIHGLWKI
jgi:superoxide reductase